MVSKFGKTIFYSPSTESTYNQSKKCRLPCASGTSFIEYRKPHIHTDCEPRITARLPTTWPNVPKRNTAKRPQTAQSNGQQTDFHTFPHQCVFHAPMFCFSYVKYVKQNEVRQNIKLICCIFAA